MPSVWEITIEAEPSTTLNPERIHAIISGWLDEPDEHHTSLKAYSTRPPTMIVSGLYSIRIGLLDDALINRLSTSVQANRGDIHLGKMPARIIASRLINLWDWDDFAERAEPIEQIRFRFTSPTMFRHGVAHHQRPSPSGLFTPLRRKWERFYGKAPHCPIDDDLIRLTRFDVVPTTVRFRGRNWTGVTGAADLDISALREEHRAALDAITAIVPFSGIGAYTTSGFGATDRVGPEW